MTLHRRLHPTTLARAAALACVTVLTPVAIAAEPPASSKMLGGMPPAPEVRREYGIDFLTGGVGIDGRAQLKPLVRDMNLQLVFAEKKTGGYLADVEVVIADRKGGEAEQWMFRNCHRP